MGDFDNSATTAGRSGRTARRFAILIGPWLVLWVAVAGWMVLGQAGGPYWRDSGQDLMLAAVVVGPAMAVAVLEWGTSSWIARMSWVRYVVYLLVAGAVEVMWLGLLALGLRNWGE